MLKYRVCTLVAILSSLGCGTVYIGYDSKLLVDMLQSRATWSWKYYSLLKTIAYIMQLGDYRLSHVFREANVVTNRLAKLESSPQMDFLFTSAMLPSDIKGLVTLDKVSFPYIQK